MNKGVYETGAYFIPWDYADGPVGVHLTFDGAKKEGHSYISVFGSDGDFEVTLKLVAGQYVEEW